MLHENDEMVYFWTKGGLIYLRHGATCIMRDTKYHGTYFYKCFETYQDALAEMVLLDDLNFKWSDNNG